MNLLAGLDAIDLARISGVQLHRHPCKGGDQADTDWSTAEKAIIAGLADSSDFYVDSKTLTSIESWLIIASLITTIKALLTRNP